MTMKTEWVDEAREIIPGTLVIWGSDGPATYAGAQMQERVWQRRTPDAKAMSHSVDCLKKANSGCLYEASSCTCSVTGEVRVIERPTQPVYAHDHPELALAFAVANLALCPIELAVRRVHKIDHEDH